MDGPGGRRRRAGHRFSSGRRLEHPPALTHSFAGCLSQRWHVQEPVKRKLTTILAADAEGYSRLMERDETAAIEALRRARAIFSRFIERHDGRIANTAGDGLIAEFPSVVEAVQCAIEVQRELGDRQGHDDLRFRIGVHLGDVIVDGSDLLGEGVNLAARLEAMARPGDVLISQQVYDQVHSKLSVAFDYVGERRPKNYSQDVPVYRIAGPGAVAETRPGADPAGEVGPEDMRLSAKLALTAKLFAGLGGALVVLNMILGGPFWSFWPGLAMAVLLGQMAAPLFARRGIGEADLRIAVLLVALAAVNIATWSGYAWSLWPIGIALGLRFLRRLASTGR